MLNNAWVSPEGEIFPVDWHGHGKFANRVLGTSYSSEQAIYKLVQQGWLHVGSTSYISDRSFSSITDAQASAIFHLMKTVTGGLIRQNLISYVHGG